MTLSPLRSSNAYIGLAKQSVKGTGVTPTLFIRWRDGSGLEPDIKMEDVEEGDTTRRLSAIIKNMQAVKVKLNFDARPIALGFIETAALGAGSDAYTGPTIATTLASVLALGATASTTLNGAVSAGGTSITVTSGTGLTPASGTIPVIIDAGTNVSEIVYLTMAASGTTFTVTALKFAHASGATVQTTAGFTLAANTGLTASNTALPLVIGAGVATEEFIKINTPGIGSGPYSYYSVHNTVTGAFSQTHAGSDTLKNSASHVITDQGGNGNYYTIEINFGGSSGMTLRVIDCMLNTVKRSGSKGGLWVYETDWMGIATTLQATPTSVVLEAHNPYLYTQIQGGVTLDASTGESSYLEQLDISSNNNLESIQTEGLIPDALLMDAIRVDASWTSPFQSTQSQNRYAQMYFGGINGTTDAQTVLNNPITVVLTPPDNFNVVTYSLPNINNVKVMPPSPKAKGGHMTQQVSVSATSAQGANSSVISVTVLNTQLSAYG